MSLTLADESDYGNQLVAFRQFLASHGKKLKSIAGATRGEFQLEDLHGEAWLMAGEIRRLRGVRIDFLDPGFQNLLLAYAKRIGQGWGESTIRIRRPDRCPWRRPD